ncbi:MAG: response regulator [Planctomycetes bacterium]|nr:response regulator [Planctomycetota bacterium]MCW8136814.1 response regulator [Planctomycetota bacterium]
MALQRNVLLVDDNIPFRSTLATVLEDEGVDTQQAGRGDEAIRLIRQVRFDLLVLDLNLPDMTGVTVYSTASEEVKKVGCIFMTAEASEELIEMALRLNPLRLLRKPFEVAMFRDLVRRAIAN